MHILAVSMFGWFVSVAQLTDLASMSHLQLVERIAMPTLVLALETFFWMMSSVAQVLASCYSATAGQSWSTTASTQLMLVWVVKVFVILMD